NRDVLLNPSVIVEVLSPSTEAFDRGEKFLRYRTWIDTLTDYVMVSQTMPLIEHYSRREDGWLLTAASELSGTILIPSIDCQLRLSEVYDRVEFPPVDEGEAESEN